MDKSVQLVMWRHQADKALRIGSGCRASGIRLAIESYPEFPASELSMLEDLGVVDVAAFLRRLVRDEYVRVVGTDRLKVLMIEAGLLIETPSLEEDQ